MSEMPEHIIVNDKQYYISVELEEKLPVFYENARKTKNRNVIVTLQIPDTEYIFANKTKTNDLWKVYTAKTKIAKLLISKDWIDTFLKNKQSKTKIIRVRRIVNTTSVVDTRADAKIDTTVEVKPIENDIVDTKVDNDIDIDDTKVDNDTDDTNNIVDTKVDNDIDDTNEAVIIEPAPPVLHLDDNEKFHDINGNTLEITTCGERHEDHIYFDMTDVSKAFEMPNLGIALRHKNGAYTRGIDYKLFVTPKRTRVNYSSTIVASNETSNETSNEKTTNKRVFLTLSGLIRVLHVSRTKNAVHYCDWVKHIVYTHQFGTQEQKEELAASVLGVSAKIIKSLYNAVTDQIPCVYLFTLGYVKDLRTSMQLSDVYDDDDVVSKYGFTKDLTRRTGEHIKKYGKIANSTLRLKHYTCIDPLYVSNAEVELKSFFDALEFKLDYENEDELVVIPRHKEKYVIQQFTLIGAKYVGHNNELITRNKFLESELKRETLAFVSQLALKNAELKQKDSEIDIIKRDSTIEQNLLKAEINQKNAEIEIIKRDSTIENNQLKAEIDKRDSTIENNLLKAENDNIKRDSIIEKQRTDMKMMVMEQQLLEHKRIIEKTN